MLAEIFTSNTRSEVLRLLFDGQENAFYLRELERVSGINVGSFQKEIAHLSELDLIKSRKDGNRIYYTANTNHPLYPDFVSIVEKTVGITAKLKDRLTDPRIDCAFIFGSYATGKTNAESDIDLVVIGELGMRALTKLLSGLQEEIGREINPHIYTPDEFKKRINNKDHFVTSILNEKHKVILGDLNEFNR